MATAYAYSGETLDALSHRMLGTTDVVEQLLTLNPGISASVTLAEGTPVILPETIPAARTLETVQLWS